MLSRRLVATRRCRLRPLRPPNIPSLQPPAPRFFTHNTQLLLIAQRAPPRPQLPFLAPPSYQAPNTFLGPNPQLARLLSTETRQYVVEQAWLMSKWTVICATFSILTLIIAYGYMLRLEEQRQPTPEEWRLLSKIALYSARQQQRAVEDGRAAVVDWAVVWSELRDLLARLEDPKCDGKGVVEQEGGSLSIPEAGKTGLDISGKSWPWCAGYYEVLMGCATAVEHLDGMVVDKTRGKVVPKECVVGPSNLDPRPTPNNLPAPKEEDCETVWPPPETYYMRILTTKGFTTKQKLDAALSHANWLEYKGLHDSAEEMYKWGVDIAMAALSISPDRVIDRTTYVLQQDGGEYATPNLLHAVTSLAIHRARTGDVLSALPILLSVLRTRRTSAVSPFPQPKELIHVGSEEPKTKVGLVWNKVKWIFVNAPFPPPPVSGDLSLIRQSESPTCEESELMMYIGEILFATSPAPEEGLGWTRRAVTTAEANLQSGAAAATALNKAEQQKCRQCLEAAVLNWEAMLIRMSEMELATSEREGERNAGWLEWSGWFGGDGGQKGRMLDKLHSDAIKQELERVQELKERIAREAFEVEMKKSVHYPSKLWIG